MTHPTDDEIMKLAGEWFHTGENQKRDDGYYYRSLGTPSNVRGSDLIEFARALLAEQARPNADKLLRELIACEDERERLVNGVEPIEQFHRDSAKLDKRFTEALAQARECVATPLQTHKAEDAPSDAELADTPTPKPQGGLWTLTAPDGRTYQADSPLRCCGLEQRERVPADVAMARIFRAASEPDDSELLDWLDSTNKRFKMGWKVGVAPAGNCSVQSIICLGNSEPVTIRAAIRAAAEIGKALP